MKNKKLLCGLIFLILLMLVLALFFKGQKYVIELSEENIEYIEVWDAKPVNFVNIQIAMISST